MSKGGSKNNWWWWWTKTIIIANRRSKNLSIKSKINRSEIFRRIFLRPKHIENNGLVFFTIFPELSFSKKDTTLNNKLPHTKSAALTKKKKVLEVWFLGTSLVQK